MKRDGKAAFWCVGTGAGLILACVLSKGLYLIGTLGNPVSIYGAAAFIRLEPQEFSFFGAELGMVLGFLLAARVTGRDRGTALDAIALPGTLLVAALRFATLYLGETGLGEFQTLGIYDLTDGVFPAFFPLAVRDSWGDWWMAVGTLEMLAALLCGVYAAVKKKQLAGAPGLLFERTSLLLCSAQVFLELLHSAGTVTYFVHTEQLWNALYILIRVILNCRRTALRRPGLKAWIPLICAVLCIAVNGVTQFFIDKPYGFLEPLPTAVGDWISDHLSLVGYGLILLSTIGLGAAALKASSAARSDLIGKETA